MNRGPLACPAVLILVTATVVSPGCATSEDVRSRLLASAERQDPDFPDGESVQLARFAYVGSVRTPSGPVYVVDRQDMITGMLAPRGLPRLDFYDRDYNLLASHWWPQAKPLWCEGSKVYLSGFKGEGPFPVAPAIRPLFAKDELPYGNVIDLSSGFAGAVLRIERRYGSSGGVEDDPWARLKAR